MLTDMKRILFFTMLASVLFCSCKKEGDAGAPSVTWAANPNFSVMEIAPGANGSVALNAPGLFESITLTLNLGDYNVTANRYIDISNNAGGAGKNPVFDIIDDSKVASFLQGMGMSAGSGLRGKSIATLDLLEILDELLEGQPLKNNTSFTISINIVDKNGGAMKKPVEAKFHFTSEPSFSWDGNSAFEAVDLNGAEIPCKVKVNAPGKIAKLTVKLDSNADPKLVDYVKNRTTGSSLTIDLIGDEKVADSFKDYFPSGKSVEGKSDVTLNFGFMFAQMYDFGASTNIFTIYAQDQNGKDASTVVKFTK